MNVYVCDCVCKYIFMFVYTGKLAYDKLNGTRKIGLSDTKWKII